MRKTAAAAGSSLFLALAPGTMAGLVPWLMTSWRFETPLWHWGATRWVGGLLVALSAVSLIHAFVRFVLEGLGTPAPVAPTRRLVVTGAYRYVRNPMYLAVAGAIVGQALLFGQLSLLSYAVIFLCVTAAFVHWYEEPTLARQFPADDSAYRANVPGWLPRLRPWSPCLPA